MQAFRASASERNGQLGEPCFRDGYQDCAFPLICGQAPGSDKVCVEAQQKGSACGGTCASGLLCTDGVCADPLPEGVECSDMWQCAEGLVCKNLWANQLDGPGAFTTPGACTKPSPIGGPCTDRPGAVNVTACAAGLDCVGGACQPSPPKVPDGGKCFQYQDCARRSCTDGVCVPPCAP